MSPISLWHLWGLGSLVLSLSSIVYYWRTTASRFPASVPWQGVRNEAFSKTRARIRELFAGLATVQDGYLAHNKKGEPFVLLDTTGRPNVILPKESVRWLVGQPDHVLSSRKVIMTKFGLEYLIPPIRKELSDGMSLAIRRDLTRNLGRTQQLLFDTIRERVDTLMGLQQSWHEVDLVGVLKPTINGVSYLTLVGGTLYHNEAFMKSLESVATRLGLGSLLIGQFIPPFILPFIGYPIKFLVYLSRKRALKYLVPEIQHRMNLIQRDKADPTFSYEPPLDIVHWSLMACPDGNATEIAALILSMALGATHTSVHVSTGTFLDLLSSPAEMGYFEAIASEAASVFQNEEDFGKLESLYKLSRTDSAIRESARRTPLSGRGIMQEVVHKNGVTLPDGRKIPYGAWLGVSLTGINYDERYYPNPHKYDPFRFSRARTEAELMGEKKNTDSSEKAVGEKTNDVDSTETVGEKINGTSTARDKPNGAWLSTTQEEFGTFGFGRHSCPGRWFASHVMKMTLAYISLKYEIQQLKERPSNMVFGDIIVPPLSAKIMVRRRVSV